jgi:hypothetical protein
MTIDDRIKYLEHAFKLTVPGTIIQRVMNQNGPGVVWSLGIGNMNSPKTFFFGSSLEEAVLKAELSVLNKGD